MEHQGALTALLFLPVGAVAGLALLEEAARRHLRVAGRLRAGYLQLRGPDRLALLLLLVTATVIGLARRAGCAVPHHVVVVHRDAGTEPDYDHTEREAARWQRTADARRA